MKEDLNNSPLHLAAQAGDLDLVKSLLHDGIPWNVLNSESKSAGEFAMAANHIQVYDFLVQEGCRAEFILGLIQQEDTSIPSNADYLSTPLKYSDGLLIDAKQDAVMMEWERSLMQKHADVIAPTENLSILNIGFGLGIIDSIIQTKKPTRHIIVEAHPDVYAQMIKDGWNKKPGVEIFFQRWQDCIQDLGVFDGVFFDTFGEFYQDLKQFHNHLPDLLKDETSIYSFFNGLAGSNPFFHDVYCAIAEMDLAEFGIATRYEKIEVPTSIEDDKVWDGVSRRYYSLKNYNLPICKIDI